MLSEVGEARARHSQGALNISWAERPEDKGDLPLVDQGSVVVGINSTPIGIPNLGAMKET